MRTQPESILNILIEQISVFARGNIKPDAFTICRFKCEANKLASVNFAESAMVKGIIACLEGNVPECIKQHELSIRNNSDPIFYQNYALSLHKIGKNAEAYRLIKIVLDQCPMIPDVLSLVIEFAFHAGHPDEALNYYEAFKKLNTEKSIPPDVLQCITESENIVSMNLPDNTFFKITSLLEAISLEHNVQPKNKSLFKMDGELFQWVETTADVSTTVDMNFQLAEKLSEQEYLNLGAFSAAFRASQ
jgi:tetratricopeptide (TPR) repeat protein